MVCTILVVFHILGCIGDGTYLSRSVPVVSMKGLMGSRLISQLRMGDFLGLALAEGKVYSWVCLI